MSLRDLLPFRRAAGCCGPARQQQVHTARPEALVHRDFDALFQAFAQDRVAPWWMPANAPRAATVNVRENEREYVVAAELPGLSEEQVQVSVENRVLHVGGEQRADDASGTRAVRYARALALPANADAAAISAKLQHGILTVTIPKLPVQDTSTRIPVVAG